MAGAVSNHTNAEGCGARVAFLTPRPPLLAVDSGPPGEGETQRNTFLPLS